MEWIWDLSINELKNLSQQIDEIIKSKQKEESQHELEQRVINEVKIKGYSWSVSSIDGDSKEFRDLHVIILPLKVTVEARDIPDNYSKAGVHLRDKQSEQVYAIEKLGINCQITTIGISLKGNGSKMVSFGLTMQTSTYMSIIDEFPV